MCLNQGSLPLVAADGVSFAYGERTVLREVSLAVRAGELVGLIGPNGSGKSTLLRVLLGILPPDAGEVRLGAQCIAALNRREIARRATLTVQDTRVDFDFTVRDIVAMGRAPHLRRLCAEQASDRAAIREALRATNTQSLVHRPITELSGGERQRVHLARALAQETNLLLLDEPTASLDLSHQFEALSIVRAMATAGKGALIALHDLALAARFCDRLLLLAGGTIVAAGLPADVISEQNLLTHFQLRARVRQDLETGAWTIIPVDTVSHLVSGIAGANNAEHPRKCG